MMLVQFMQAYPVVACYLAVSGGDLLSGLWIAHRDSKKPLEEGQPKPEGITWGGLFKSLPRHSQGLLLLLLAAVVQRLEASGISLDLANAQTAGQAGAAIYLQTLAIKPTLNSLLDNLRALGWIPPDGPVAKRLPEGKPVPEVRA